MYQRMQRARQSATGAVQPRHFVKKTGRKWIADDIRIISTQQENACERDDRHRQNPPPRLHTHLSVGFDLFADFFHESRIANLQYEHRYQPERENNGGHRGDPGPQFCASGSLLGTADFTGFQKLVDSQRVHNRSDTRRKTEWNAAT